MQTHVNSLQPRFVEGMVNPQIPFLPLARYTEDDGCQAGRFVFEGSNPERTVVSTKSDATVDNLVGVLVRTPFQSYSGQYNDIYANGSSVTVLARGNVCVTASNVPAYKDKVFVNPSTGEIQTGSGNTPEGFLDSGYRVSQTINCGNVVEISNIQFN